MWGNCATAVCSPRTLLDCGEGHSSIAGLVLNHSHSVIAPLWRSDYGCCIQVHARPVSSIGTSAGHWVAPEPRRVGWCSGNWIGDRGNSCADRRIDFHDKSKQPISTVARPIEHPFVWRLQKLQRLLPFSVCLCASRRLVGWLGWYRSF